MFLFILAVAAERFGILVHAFCVLSNHFHLVLTDPHAKLPAFSRYLDSLVARTINASLGRWEQFWAPSTYSAVVLQTPQDVLAKIAYVLANPVAAGLVKHGRNWPGLWSAPESIGGDEIVVERPKHFFRPDGPMPSSAPLRLHRPAGFDSDEAFDAQLIDALASLEAEAAARLSSENRCFAGATSVLAQKPNGRPATGEPRRRLNPRVACRDKWKRVEALNRLAKFVQAYRAALAAWRNGIRSALFPPGTYLLRINHGVACAAT